jgi:ribosomal protein L12E/L44/L45/RPP1/RPP2
METINMSEIDGDRRVKVFVTNSINENKIFNQLQAWGQSLIQNDKANLSHLITILEGRSVAEIKTEIRAFEAESNQREQQAQEAQMKAAQEAMAYQRETDVMLEQMKTDREIQKAEISSFAFQKDQDIDDNGIPDQLETDKFIHDQYVDEQQLKLKKRELDIKQQIANKPKPGK